MAYNKSSNGYKIGKSILGEGKTKPDSSPLPASDAPNANLHSIDVRPAANGFSISHTPKDGKHGGEDYGKQETNVFDNAAKAHHHLGRLMGVISAATSGTK